MQTVSTIINFLETIAPLHLQESYDNAGWVCGNKQMPCTGVMVSLDLTTAVIEEAIKHQCNLVVVHHPPLFKPLKRIMEGDAVSDLLIRAIRNDIAVYAAHTNLDNVLWGVNGEIASRLSLQKIKTLSPLSGTHRKLVTFAPLSHAEAVKTALFEAGAGTVGQYSECSFTAVGKGTFKPLEAADPFIGTRGQRHTEEEERIEVLFPFSIQPSVLGALFKAHPYETVAYDILGLENKFDQYGGGAVGHLPEAMDEESFLRRVKSVFNTGVIRHSPFTGKRIQRVALCGGAGKSLINNALSSGADVFVTADLGYHDFFMPQGKMLLADIGHYESEQYTSALLERLLKEKFPNFAVLKSGVRTNPVNYFL